VESKQLTRRALLKGAAATGLVGLTSAGLADAAYVEPKKLVVRRVDIHLPRLPEAFHGFRLAQISDLHYGPYLGKPEVARAIELAREFHPDVVVLTGDFVSHPLHQPNGREGARFIEPCADELATFRDAPLIASLGNHDHLNDADTVESGLRERNITVLRNQNLPLERENSRIWLSGIDDALLGAADLPQALRGIPANETKILLAHEPDYADYAARFAVDLQLSGHSHGGQVRLPGIGALVLPELAENYPMGLNRVRELQVYTNVGVGVIDPPVRFLCPPEVTWITLLRAVRT
jgi:uncharacterized protein